MTWMQRSLAILATLVLGIGALFGPARHAFAQSSVPSADQIDLFRNLTPEQQDAILKQLGGSAGGLGSVLGGSGGLGSSTTDRQGQQQDAQGRGQNTDQQRSQRDEEIEPLIPVMKADDWVIVEIDFHLPPRPIPQYPQQIYGTQGALLSQSLQAQGAAAARPQVVPPSNIGSASQSGQDPSQSVTLTDEERGRLEDLMVMIRAKNPYRLNHDGVLDLPGFAGIALLGLTEDQASLRLKIEPAFRAVDVRITRLPLTRTGAESLKPFGYDLFARSPTTFAPVTNVPVPSDYIVGAGDELSVQLYGNQNRTLRLVVGRDGRISFPELGPIEVGGQLFSSVQASIEARIARQMIGVHGSVSMGDTRSIRVFVLGEAKRPGSYTISGLGTITSALFAAGGVKPIGSLRKIQLKRHGSLVRELDLYDLLIRGDTTDDAQLLQGDVIFIPPVGATVGAEGEVRRPAVYEIKNESSVEDIVRLAGGLTPEAETLAATITRIDGAEHRVVIPVDLSVPSSRSQPVQNGDFLRITRLRPTLDAGVVLQGHLYTPGTFAFHPGMHLSDVIRSVDELRPNADIHYVLIRRELPPDRRIKVLSVDLGAALMAPRSAANLELQARDRIMVFDLASGRDRVIQPILDELRLQSNSTQPTEVVHVDGRVKVPGDYPLEPGMTVVDLLRAGGGLGDAAYGSKAELARYIVDKGEVRRTKLIDIDLAAALRGEPSGNLTLEPFDSLSIKEVPEWQQLEGVTLRGEVRFPGHYSIRRGETLKAVIERAGGLTSYSFPEGSVFTRVELKKREQEQLDMLAERTQRDLTMLALQGAAAGVAGQGGGGSGGAALTVGQSLLGQLRAAKAVGRLVIDLPDALRLKVGSPKDVILRDGDELFVPKFQQQVTVIGEVQNATSHLYSPGYSRDDYISLSGGITRRADHKRIYVVHANGSVVSNEGNRWFQSSSREGLKPGDTVVVPLDTERLPPLPFWQAVTGIIYNVAIAAAAVHSF